jgi:hypothetical protein
MTLELAAAVERYKGYASTVQQNTDTHYGAAMLLASAYIAHLDTQAARDEQRARFITPERIVPLGFIISADQSFYRLITKDLLCIECEIKPDGFIEWELEDVRFNGPQDMGQLLDLLAALGVEVGT